jgi:hypothetical protein
MMRSHKPPVTDDWDAFQAADRQQQREDHAAARQAADRAAAAARPEEREQARLDAYDAALRQRPPRLSYERWKAELHRLRRAAVDPAGPDQPTILTTTLTDFERRNTR